MKIEIEINERVPVKEQVNTLLACVDKVITYLQNREPTGAITNQDGNYVGQWQIQHERIKP